MKDKPLKAADFEESCKSHIMGDLWDETFNGDYQEMMSFTINELRYISTLLHRDQKLPQKQIIPFLPRP